MVLPAPPRLSMITLCPAAAKSVGDQPRHHVDRAAGRGRHDDMHDPARIFVLRCRSVPVQRREQEGEAAASRARFRVGMFSPARTQMSCSWRRPNPIGKPAIQDRRPTAFSRMRTMSL